MLKAELATTLKDNSIINWNDWRWQVSNSVIGDGPTHNATFMSTKISPYFYSLIDMSDALCPIRQQVCPSDKELSTDLMRYNREGINTFDSLSEEKLSPVKGLIHRYPDRVLLIMTNNCFTNCRFCTRKRLVSLSQTETIDLEAAYNYIKTNSNIHDVILSGGDPLTLEDEKIDEVLSSLREIPHVDIVRIGTRAPVVMPMRITNELVAMLARHHPIWINTHFNHKKELTNDAKNACEKIINAGIPLGNQTVLLKGINDTVDCIRDLCLGLVKMRVRPYYLYQCDIGAGNDHFRTKVQVGIDIIGRLRQNISGFAIPNYVIDAPNGGGKFVINPNFIVERAEEKIVLKNAKGQLFVYPETNNESDLNQEKE
ncbi:L-lysine 2,3-aminomutase [Clostridia bacterium]|nr:L-lysine 2,3-aminomutase [Clostridia bacterium]